MGKDRAFGSVQHENKLADPSHTMPARARRSRMPTKVTVKSNGSIHVEGDFELFDQNGGKFDLNGRTLIKLCRCGASKNQPLCDSAHKTCGFKSEIVARVLPPPAPKV